jgi:hypothetical protein
MFEMSVFWRFEAVLRLFSPFLGPKFEFSILGLFGFVGFFPIIFRLLLILCLSWSILSSLVDRYGFIAEF